MAKLKIKQSATLPKAAVMDALGHIIIILPETAAGISWPTPDNVWPYADLLKQRWSQQKDKDDLTPLTTDLPNVAGSHLTLACVKPNIPAFDLLTLARKLCGTQLSYNPSEIMLLLPGWDESLAVAAGTDTSCAGRITEAVVAALLAGIFAMPSFKSKPPKSKRLATLHVYGVAGVDLARTFAEAEGNNLARYLTNLPPNELTPAMYRQRIADLAEQNGWNMHFFDSKALRRQKAGAFLAVAQGSADDDAGIVQLCYHPPKTRAVHGRTSVAKGRMPEATTTAKTPGKQRLSLVGKGICYDTGGNNLKPAKSMFGMHEDMEGSAVALGTLLALTHLKVNFSVHCWLALAQNHIGPKAYKQNDVVTASNGVTIEIVHTDAEGRMVLADTLAMASAERPDLIIDYATLTGTCVYALGTRYSGAFTNWGANGKANRDEMLFDIIEAGRNSGERVWPFPNDSDYDKELESDIADVKQCVLAGEADHILATRFLNRFVRDDVPWLHIDLAAGNHKGGLAHIPTNITGFGVRFTLNLVLDRGVMNKQKNI